MNFEDLQKAWKTQDAGARVTIDSALLLKEVRRNQYYFWMTIFWRDVREVGVAAFMTWLFWHWAARDRLWAGYVLSLGCFCVGAFMLVDRWIQRKKRPAANDPLRSCIEASLIQVKHQIWLLRNIFWWYLLPVLVGMVVFVGSLAWEWRQWRPGFSFIAGFALFCGLFFWGVYWLNRFVARKYLDPRRQELETLLAGLDENSQ